MTELLVRMQRALPHVRSWIDELHAKHSDHATAAHTLGFVKVARWFPESLLQDARAVAVDEVPFPPVSAYGLPEFETMASMNMAGITFGRMYFVRQSCFIESVHFHELVHVVQWQTLGVDEFLLTYALGVARHGYAQSPLEAIAYELQSRFERDETPGEVIDRVASHARRARDAAAEVFGRSGLTMGA